MQMGVSCANGPTAPLPASTHTPLHDERVQQLLCLQLVLSTASATILRLKLRSNLALWRRRRSHGVDPTKRECPVVGRRYCTLQHAPQLYLSSLPTLGIRREVEGTGLRQAP